jgi:hypothetical protein
MEVSLQAKTEKIGLGNTAGNTHAQNVLDAIGGPNRKMRDGGGGTSRLGGGCLRVLTLSEVLGEDYRQLMGTYGKAVDRHFAGVVLLPSSILVVFSYSVPSDSDFGSRPFTSYDAGRDGGHA